MEELIKIGLLLIFAGMLLTVIGALLSAKGEDVKVAVGGFIGPIPFGFANDTKLLVLVIALSLICLIAFLLMLKG